MGTFPAHRIEDIDEGHTPPCFERSTVMKGVKTVLINKKPVRTVITGFNSVHIIPPPPPVGCLTHSGIPIPSDGSQTVFANGRNVMRLNDPISAASGLPPCTKAIETKGTVTVFVG